MTDTTAPIAPTVGNNDCGNANVINVGVPGNIRPVILAPGQSYTVADVVNRAGFNAGGYELRISGDRANLETRVQPGQTVLLLKAVRGA
jgi:hypothetical protein